MMEIPRRKKGRPSKNAESKFNRNLKSFCDEIKQINSRLDFKVSSRGWCYILEPYGLLKSDFDHAQKLINDCRKSGLLPLDICKEDDNRTFNGIESVDNNTPDQKAEFWIDYILNSVWKGYNGVSFWDNQEFYVQMMVEKIDLVSLFEPICRKYKIPIANTKGWSDISQRADMMRRYAMWEAEGKTCVLLYCGDHDPAGLAIKEHLKNNLMDLLPAIGWSPDNLLIDRFGLNADFIAANNLSWIDNLITGGNKDLASPKHSDHNKPYVQGYIKKYGVRKCEANALVVRPKRGRQLCLDAVHKYVSPDAPKQHEQSMMGSRLQVRDEIHTQLEQRFAA
jgi:hypothetical protein